MSTLLVISRLDSRRRVQEERLRRDAVVSFGQSRSVEIWLSAAHLGDCRPLSGHALLAARIVCGRLQLRHAERQNEAQLSGDVSLSYSHVWPAVSRFRQKNLAQKVRALSP